MKVILLVALVSSLLISSSKSRPQQVNDSISLKIDPGSVDAFITRQMALQRVPGLALAITQGDKVIFLKGYGKAGHGEPVTPQTQFFIASVSKSFTALAVMQLVEAGKLNLDAPVQSYLPQFAVADPAVASQVTIRELLQQTSGLSEIGFPDMVLPQPGTIEERVTSLRGAQPVAIPGTEYHYFSPNYAILARLVEIVSGQPFSEYLHQHVFIPLDMSQTFNAITTSEGYRNADHLAQGHLVVFGIAIPFSEPYGYLGGSGGVISTAEDMAHYLIAQIEGGRYLDQQVVTEDSLDIMHSPPAGIDSTYAMGWVETTKNGLRVLEHNGILSTFSSDVILLPDQDIGIALLYNASSFATNTFASPQIRDGLINILNGQQPESIPMSAGLWGLITALLTAVGGFLAARSLIGFPRWSQKACSTPLWRQLPGILWAFLPGLVLLSFPGLSTRFSDRVFGFVNFYKSMPGIFLWLGITGILGAANGAARTARLVSCLRLKRGRDDK